MKGVAKSYNVKGLQLQTKAAISEEINILTPFD